MNFLVSRKRMIKEFATEIAELQRKADINYYERDDKDHASWLIDKAAAIQEMASRLGIFNEAQREAHKIYDFRDSGREGYTLHKGKIIKVSDLIEDCNDCSKVVD